MINFSKIKYLLIIFLLNVISNAQGNFELNLKIKASSLDNKKQIVLYANGELEKFYDGYIVFPNFMDRIQGNMQKGGFSFIDYTGLGTLFETKKQWEQLAKNKFPSGNLEVFSNGFDADKVLSFRIIPEFVNDEDDTVSIFIKYVLYDFNNDQVDYFNWDTKINLYNKLIRIPLDEEIPFKFFDDKLGNYKLSVYLSKNELNQKSTTIKNYNLFKAIKIASENLRSINQKFKFDLNFGKSNKLSGNSHFPFSPNGETQTNVNLIDVGSFNTVKFDSEIINISNKIYHSNITIPFDLQNSSKSKIYESYSSREKIFTSEYNLYFLPLSVKEDSLIGELFISIQKLKIGDEIERWSPIQKRVSMKIFKRNTNNITTNSFWASLIFELPKENWSAFFSRGGEDYEIYGYSDYERFVNEYISISISDMEAKE